MILKVLMHIRVLERGKAQKTLVKPFKGILTWVLSWEAIKPPRRRKNALCEAFERYCRTLLASLLVAEIKGYFAPLECAVFCLKHVAFFILKYA